MKVSEIASQLIQHLKYHGDSEVVFPCWGDLEIELYEIHEDGEWDENHVEQRRVCQFRMAWVSGEVGGEE